MSRDGYGGRNAWPSCIYTALVKENPPRSRLGSRGAVGFNKGGRPLDVSWLRRVAPWATYGCEAPRLQSDSASPTIVRPNIMRFTTTPGGVPTLTIGTNWKMT
jgi:hypothetical protein